MIEDESTGPSVTPNPPRQEGGPVPFVLGALGIVAVLALLAVGVAAWIIFV